MATDSTEAVGVRGPDGNMILVVEDDERTSRLERFVLEEEGFLVACAGSGEEALKMLPDTSPSLVLLDIMLPNMDGFITCQKIRETSQVPIIMVTGEGRDEDKVRGLEMGADDYITKPFSTNELAARVKAVLRRINRSQSNSVAARPRPSEPDMSFLDEPSETGEREETVGKSNGEFTQETSADAGKKSKAGPKKPSGIDQDPAIGEGAADAENYEGAVKLVVETTGAIKNLVDFVDALRETPSSICSAWSPTPGETAWMSGFASASPTRCEQPCWRPMGC